MKNWHGYLILKRPPALTVADFEAALHEAGRTLATPSNQPDEIPHWAWSTDESEIILEALWADDAKLTVAGLAKALANTEGSKQTEAQLLAALAGGLTLAGKGKSKLESRDAALQYRNANRGKNGKWADAALDAGTLRSL